MLGLVCVREAGGVRIKRFIMSRRLKAVLSDIFGTVVM